MRIKLMLVLLGAMTIAGCTRSEETTSVTTTASSVESSTTGVPAPSSPPTTEPSTIPTTTVEPTTTLAPTTTMAPTTTSTSAPATTLPPGGCGSLSPLPAGAVESASQLVDADADGLADTVRTYATNSSPVAGDWRLRVELAAGGGAEVVVPDDPAPAAVRVLGGAYFGSNVDPGVGGQRPALFVVTGAGASASIITLFRLDGCGLATMTLDGSGPATFGVGGGVVHAENLFCDGAAGTVFLVYREIVTNDGGASFDVSDTAFTRSGNDVVTFNALSPTNQPTMPSVSSLIDCGGVESP